MGLLDDADKVLQEGLELAWYKPGDKDDGLKFQIRIERAQIIRKKGYVIGNTIGTLLMSSSFQK